MHAGVQPLHAANVRHLSSSGRAQLKLESLQRRWNSLGVTNAFWAVLGTSDSYATPWNADEFFRTGSDDVALVLKNLEVRGVLPRKRSALDFGCGVGRLTQPLAELFDRVVGVDIAPSMIEQAARMNRFPKKCSYVVNAEDDLHTFPSGTFDFVISRMVLQHLPRKLADRYLSELLRVVADEGVLVVQIPSRRISRRSRYLVSRLLPGIFSILRKATGRPPRIPMYVIPRRDVLAAIRNAGAKVIHVASDGASGRHFESLVYYVIRRA